MFALQSVWFVFGFLVSLPPAISLTCHGKVCLGSFSSLKTQDECTRENDDRCQTLTMEDNGRPFRIYSCAPSSSCDTAAVCERFQQNTNRTITNCVVSCCSTDLCNDSGEFSATHLDYGVFTGHRRSIVKGEGHSRKRIFSLTTTTSFRPT